MHIENVLLDPYNYSHIYNEIILYILKNYFIFK